MFKEGAGQYRGFVISRDPDGILFSPFDYMGTQMGYVLVYGQGVPAIHDGNDWVPILTDDAAENFEEKLQDLIVEQGTKIAAAIQNPVYAELATQMGMFANAGASTTATPGTADPGPDVFRFGE